MSRRRWAAMVLLVLALAVAACSRGGREAQPDGGATTGKVGEVPQPGAGYGAPENGVSGGASSAASGGAGTGVTQDDVGRKVVKTAQLGISSRDVRGDAVGAQQVATRFGGTTLSSRTYRADNATYADLLISVPSGHFEDALDELRGLGEQVTTDTVSGQDVTEEYVDLQSQERNLRAAEQTLLNLYNGAANVQDALAIQRELTTVRGQIEQVQGRIQYLKKSSDMARISLSIRPVASPPKPRPAWDPALVVAKAWTASLTLLQSLASAILSTLVFGWWIIPPLVLGAWWLRRRSRRQGFAPGAPEGGES